MLLGTTTEGYSGGDDLTISTSGDTGMTIRSGTSNQGILAFSDGTSGADEYRGYVQYLHNGNALLFGTDATERLRITSAGNVGINENSPDNLLHLTTNSSSAYSTSETNTVNATNALLRLENTNGSDGSGVNNYVGMYFRVGSGANSDAQLQYVRSGDNAGTFHFLSLIHI